MSERKTYNRYSGELKVMVVETMLREKLSHREAARRFGISNAHRVISWEKIYMEDGPQGLFVERRGSSSKVRSPK